MCATLSDGQATRLAFFIGGTLAVDMSDSASTLTDTGWIGGLLLAASDTRPTTMTVSRFEERDLAA